MRPARLLLLLSLTLAAASPGVAQEPKADVKAAASKVVGVTVYQNTALVTREVTVPDAVGPVEVTGEMISDASSGLATTQTGASTGQWVVNIVFNDEGTAKFADVEAVWSGLR